MLRGRESNTIPVETKIVQDFGWDNSSPELSQSVPPTQIADATANRGPPLPANGLPEGWTMEQWEYYGEQYLATNPEVASPVYSEPAPQTYVQPEPVYTQPAPTATFTEPASSLCTVWVKRKRPFCRRGVVFQVVVLLSETSS